MGRKNNDIEYNDRIDEVIKQVAKGNTTTSGLLRFITEKYNLSVSQAEKDIATARDRIRENKHEEIGNEIEDAVLRYKYLIHLNFALKDYREVRACQAELNKLLGLDAPKRTEISGPNGGPIETKATTLAELREILDDK